MVTVLRFSDNSWVLTLYTLLIFYLGATSNLLLI